MSVREGQLVRNPQCPDWGPGRVIKVEGHVAHVFFADAPGAAARKIHLGKVSLQPAGLASHPWLDNLPPFTKRDGAYRMDEGRLTPRQAVEKFLALFPAGFEDAGYRSRERDYKVEACALWSQLLGASELRTLLEGGRTGEFVERALKVESRLNLLSLYEKAALRQGLSDAEAARGFHAALLGVVEEPVPTPEAFAALVAATERLPQPGSKVVTWPVVTLFPFVARPERHMFLKPEVTKEAGRRHGFELNYDPWPNWRTYSCCLQLAHALEEELRPHKAKDLLDVQSFIWVVSKYDEPPVTVGG